MMTRLVSLCAALLLPIAWCVPAHADVIDHVVRSDGCTIGGNPKAGITSYIDLKDNGTPNNTSDDLIDYDANDNQANGDLLVWLDLPEDTDTITVDIRKDEVNGSGTVSDFWMRSGGPFSAAWPQRWYDFADYGLTPINKSRHPFLKITVKMNSGNECVSKTAYNNAWIS